MNMTNQIARSKTAKVLLFILLSILILASLGYLMAYLHGAQQWQGGLFMFDQDLSDSVLGWMIAIPIIALVFALVILIMLGVGIILSGVVAMVVVLALLAAIFGIAMAVLPVAAFLAVPILLVWLAVKLAMRNVRNPPRVPVSPQV
jgi:hypothetical protein